MSKLHTDENGYWLTPSEKIKDLEQKVAEFEKEVKKLRTFMSIAIYQDQTLIRDAKKLGIWKGGFNG